MLSPEGVEAALAASWPALETIVDGGWEARFAKGYSGRSNSIQVLDPADDHDAAARIESLSALYCARGLLPMVKVTPLTGPDVRATIAGPGWDTHHDSLVLAASMGSLDFGRPDDGTHVVAPDGAEWLDIQARLQGYSTETSAVLAALMERLSSAAGFVRVDGTGTPLASALCSIAQGVATPLNVVTAPAARGRGHGRAVMHAVLAWARAAGARSAAIQVLRDNAPAVSLYQSLGFSYLYSYQYRCGRPAP